MKKEVQNSFIVVFALVLVSILLLFTQTSITGNVVYEYQESSYTWDFSNPNDYTYDNSKISLTQNQASLIQLEEDNSWTEETTNFALITQALKNGNDKTSKIISVGSGDEGINKNDILDITFDNNLNNGDIINLYLKHNKVSNIYLCDENTQCNDSNYGSLEYPGDKGWYSITIENLQEPKNIFGFDSNYKKVKFDYINATYTTTILHEVINNTYYDSSIETKDLTVEDLSEWGTLTIDDDSNNQIISYQYSIDSGNTWEEINNLSNVNSNKIRFKINLESDNTGTPSVNSLSLSYITSYCTENWDCTSWNECNENNLQTRTCNDLNECGTIINKPDETQDCVYYRNYYDINNNDIISIKKDTLTTLNSTNTILEILSNEDANFTNFTLRNYDNHYKTISDKISLDKYIDIENNLNLNNAILKIYYKSEEINSLNEDSLKIYYYNETLEEWQELESFVNKQENYVWTNLSHFSTYGVFGNEISSGSSPSSSSGGSRGGSSGSSSTKKEENIIPKEIEEEIKETQEEKEEIFLEVIKEKTEENIFRIFTGRVVDKFRDKASFFDILIFLLILLSILTYKSISFFKRKQKNI